MYVSISEDYKEKPTYEKQILGKYLLPHVDFDKTEILLLWRRLANQEYLEKFKNLKFIIRYGTGYDNIDLTYIKSKKIKLFNNPDYCINEVADTVIGLILSRMRRINQYHEISKKILEDDSLYNFKNTIDDVEALKEKNFGVIGAGRIGQLVLNKSKLLFDNIGFFDPYVKKSKLSHFKKFNSLDKFIKWCDVISINANLNESNKKLINKNFLNNLKKKTIIINLARFEFIENLNDIFKFISLGKIDFFAIDIEMKEILKKKIMIKKFLKKFPDSLSIHPHSSFYSKQSYTLMRKNTAILAFDIIKNKSLVRNRIRI